jgi:hypothetical protein
MQHPASVNSVHLQPLAGKMPVPNNEVKRENESESKCQAEICYAELNVKKSMDLDSLRHILKVSASSKPSADLKKGGYLSSVVESNPQPSLIEREKPQQSGQSSVYSPDVKRKSSFSGAVPTVISPRIAVTPRAHKLPPLDMQSDNHTSFDTLFDQFSAVNVKEPRPTVTKFNDIEKIDIDLADLLQSRAQKFVSAKGYPVYTGPAVSSGRDSFKQRPQGAVDKRFSSVHIPSSGLGGFGGNIDSDVESGIETDSDEDDEGIDWISTTAVRPDKVNGSQGALLGLQSSQAPPPFSFGRGLVDDPDDDDDVE